MSKEDFEKLFIKLNYVRQARPAKEEAQLNPSWSNKNVRSVTILLAGCVRVVQSGLIAFIL